LIPVIFFMKNLMPINKSIPAIEAYWEYYFQIRLDFLISLILPFTVILLVSQLIQIEVKNNTFKQLYTTPLSFAKIFTSKFLLLMGYMVFYFLLFLFTSIIFTFIEVWLFNYPNTLKIKHIQDLFFKLCLLFIRIFPLLSFQFFLSFFIKRTFIEFLLSLIVILITFFYSQSNFIWLSPFSYLLLAEHSVEVFGWFSYYLAIIYALLINIITFYLYNPPLNRL
jgi:hypothetical protein